MREITLLDTSISSTNLGDQIIMDAVHVEIAEMFPEAYVYAVASHDYMGHKSHSLIRRSELTLAGGTNLLSSHMWFRPLWKVTPLDMLRQLNVTLMGVGWYQFQHKPDLYTRALVKSLLHKHHTHSVRDNYSLKMLKAAGVLNVVNTGCPTLWRLTPDHCRQVPVHKAENVLTTLNTYFENPELDRELLVTLRKHYKNIYFWVQTKTDYEYAKALDPDLRFLHPSVQALNEFLESDIDLDYVGNRLHAGIRALQKKRRCITVVLDNRAQEMGRDFGLVTVARDDFSQLASLIENPFPTQIRLPVETIRTWKNQFHLLAADTSPVTAQSR